MKVDYNIKMRATFGVLILCVTAGVLKQNLIFDSARYFVFLL